MHCPHTKQCTAVNKSLQHQEIFEKILGMLKIEPRLSGWEARTLPLCYANPQRIILFSWPLGQACDQYSTDEPHALGLESDQVWGGIISINLNQRVSLFAPGDANTERKMILSFFYIEISNPFTILQQEEAKVTSHLWTGAFQTFILLALWFVRKKLLYLLRLHSEYW